MDIEIERLARILDRKDTRLIDYNAFLDRLKGPMLPEPDLLKECLSRLLIFLRHNKLNTLRLLKKLGNPVSVNTFANFLHQKIMKKANMGKLFDVADKIDLN